ncbi:DASH complex subunit Spc19 [Daldinia caldariorum]|uniref:DASH complex subunit Spc19 n=1 Tax=Daldinia caldariorum TaxID=326644 RepID=UPI0020080423|nr:DASH complex subunit Spc19 [Daldinia caldariorum]KAI1464567.1 DASH complex subunit Spc19 [Daldinia caldariorum]
MATITTTTSSNAATYGDCVAALRTSLSFLESSVSTLGTGIADYPRLVNVLKSVRHYELIPQPALVAAEASLRDEIGPAIATLLDRADAHIERAERRIDALRARSELQQGRMHSSTNTTSTTTTTSSARTAANNKKNIRGGTGAGAARRRTETEGKIKARQREALQYSVERLELEVLQKERELRKRLDAAT